jgi:Zn-dependent M28 family amino/carboxypeptidase
MTESLLLVHTLIRFLKGQVSNSMITKGINDNGSGSATLLEISKLFSKNNINMENKVRFCFFSGEELGLLGSKYYVENLSDSEKKKISLNLNFDMIGSPNFIRGIYDGSSAADENIRIPSSKIQKLFENHFTSLNLSFVLTSFDGRSDYGPFIGFLIFYLYL